MRPYYYILILFFLSQGNATYAKLTPIDSLRKQIEHYYRHDEYKIPMQLLSDFMSDNKRTPYEMYSGYLIKSKIYKKLFNYEQALYNLDLALEEGRNSVNRVIIEQEVKAEKSFIYFDMQEFGHAKKIMEELERTGYRNLSSDYLLFLYTQKGYFLVQDKNYVAAEKALDKAMNIAKKYRTQDLPIVYGKQIELYNSMQDTIKRDKIYKEGIRVAKRYGNIKYEFYLNEIMKNVFRKNNDYKNAFDYQKKCDSVFLIYNSNSKSSKIELLEQQIKKNEYEFEIQNKRNVQLFLIALSVLLIFVVFILIKLFITNKQKRILIEKENQYIYSEIERLTNLTNNKGLSKVDLSVFNLTERQKEIIGLVRQGKNNKEIAATLFISENTVKYHLKAIYNILDIKQRNEL
ncbi:MAG: LuxR family transcriptional regulator [Flavobacterium sp.]|nr:MAG: LuxR family transcriptional regulator [Flavobacterium sp.]